MPRFRKPPAELVIRTGEPPDHVVWRFNRTAAIERALTAAHGIDDPAARGTALLAAMVEALQGWEGVLDEEGRPLPYSPVAFFEYVPAAVRAEVLRQWVARMLGAPETAQLDAQEGDARPSEPDDVGQDPDRDEAADVAVSSRAVRAREFAAEDGGRQPDEQPAFVAEPASPPATEAPLAEKPVSPPEEPRDPAPLDLSDARGQGSSPETDDHTRRAPAPPAPRPPGSADLSQPSARVAQAASLRPFPPPPTEQPHRAPALQTNPSPRPARLLVLAADPGVPRPPAPLAVPSACADQPCPVLDPDFNWEPLIRRAWEALHKQTRREETAEAAF